MVAISAISNPQVLERMVKQMEVKHKQKNIIYKAIMIYNKEEKNIIKLKMTKPLKQRKKNHYLDLK